MCNQLVASVADRMDPLQFAYKARRGVEDACLILVNLIASQLDKSGSYVRVMLMDFSSAFNTIQPHLLIKRLLDLGANTLLSSGLNSYCAIGHRQSASVEQDLMS